MTKVEIQRMKVIKLMIMMMIIKLKVILVVDEFGGFYH